MRRIVIAANVRRPDTPPHRLRHVHGGARASKRIDNDVAGFRKEPQQVLHHLRRHGAEVGLAASILVGRRELPDVEVLTGVGWRIFRICGFCATYPSPDRFMVSTLERRIFPADDLSDIALAVTVEPQVIGAILHGTLLFGTCVLGPALDRIATDTKKLSEIGDAFRNRRSPSDIQSPPDLAAPRARSFPLARVGR